jgi:PAS domain S-box-containing protein
VSERTALPGPSAQAVADDIGSAGWRSRVFDRLSAAAAVLLGVMLLFGARELRFGAHPLRDALVIFAPFLMLVTAAWRGAPYRLRVLTFLGCLLSLEFLGVLGYGYVAGTILLALLGVGLAGLLLGRRWAVGTWALSTAVLLGSGLAIDQGWMRSGFDPALVDPGNLRVAVRVSVAYAAFSGMLAVGVYLVVDRLSDSLRETRRALEDATSARSERARAVVEKTALEAQFHSLVEHAPDSIAIVGRDHRVLFANHQTLDGPRLTPNPVGLLADELVAPEHASRVREAIDRVFASGESVSYDVQVEVEGRGWTWYSSRVGPVVEDGRIDRVIVVSSDISERLDLEERLLQAQKLEAVGQLTGGVAHDFNNLLTVVLGNLQLVESGLGEGDPARRFVDNARRAARRGAALTHRLLAFARRQALQPRVIDLGKLLLGMDDLLKRTLDEAVAVELRVADDLWSCEVDPAQLENVILNLAINARDAMPSGGQLVIEARNIDLPEETARHHEGLEAGPYVELSIADTGTGMQREVLDHAFEPFFTTKGLGHGSGLGLSMVYGFVRQSGGSVEIESELGKGTRVRVYLPRVDGAVSAAALPALGELEESRDWPHGSGELVLVVEDDDEVRALTVTLLERAGYKTVEAADGDAAVSLLERLPNLALVFTDVVLPGGTSGVDLAEIVQSKRPGLPVLFTSGYTENALGSRGRLRPGATLVEKPFSQAELAEKVRAALSSKHS